MHKTESNPPPSCMFAAELHLKLGSPYELHTHACTEIVYFKGCTGWIVQDGHRHRYAGGNVLVYQPGMEHANQSRTTGSHICIGVLGCGAELLKPGMWKANRGIASLFGLISAELKLHRRDRQHKLDLLCGLIAIEMRRILSRPPDSESRAGLSYHVQATKGILDTRFTEPLTIGAIADSLFIGPDYLRQLFRRQVGQSPIHYLIRKRLDCACELLRATPAPIQEVASRTGFQNAYYFSRLFRKWIGVSPSEYRNERNTPRR